MSAVARRAWMAYGLAASVIVLDQWIKHWLLSDLGLTPGVSMGPWGPVRLTLVANDGISFGFLQSSAAWTRWALIGFSVAVSLGLAAWARRTERFITAVAIGLIMGGALGNMIDRLARGAVVDFLDVHALSFPWVFNLADSAISAGIALLIAESLLAPRRA